MAKVELENIIAIDPEKYMESLLGKVDRLVGLKEALIEMFNHNIDHHAMSVVQNDAFKTRDEIESMLEELKIKLKSVLDLKPCTHGDDPYNPVV